MSKPAPAVVHAEAKWYHRKSKLPRSLLRKTDARDIFLSGNKLEGLQLPPDLVQRGMRLCDYWNSVAFLELSGNKFKEFPTALFDLKASLKALIMDDNMLTSLPDSIGELAGLEQLGVSSNQLAAVPETIGTLANLKQLILRWNNLASLPDSFADLHSLEQLDLSNNLFEELPACVCRLSNLAKLRIVNIPDNEFMRSSSHNQLTTLPEDIAFLTSLDTLSLNGNKRFSYFPRGYFALLNRGKLRNVDMASPSTRYMVGAMQVYFMCQKSFHRKAIKNFVVGESAELCELVCRFGRQCEVSPQARSADLGILESTVQLEKKYRVPRPKQKGVDEASSTPEDTFDVHPDTVHVASVYIPDDCLPLVKNFVLHGSSVVTIVVNGTSVNVDDVTILDQQRVGSYIDMIRGCRLTHTAFQVVFVFSDRVSSDRMLMVQAAVRQGIITRLRQWKLELESRMGALTRPSQGDPSAKNEASASKENQAGAVAKNSVDRSLIDEKSSVLATTEALKHEISCLPTLLNSGVLLQKEVRGSTQGSETPPPENAAYSFQPYSDSFHQLANPLSEDALNHYFPNLPPTNPLRSCYPGDKLNQPVWPVVFSEVPNDWLELGSCLSPAVEGEPGLQSIVSGTVSEIIGQLQSMFSGCEIFDPQFQQRFKDYDGYFLKFLNYLSHSSGIVFLPLPAVEDGMAMVESQNDITTTYVIVSEPPPKDRYVLARLSVFTSKVLSITNEIKANAYENNDITAKGLVPVSLLSQEPLTPKFFENQLFCVPYFDETQSQDPTTVLIPALLSEECGFPNTPLLVAKRDGQTMYSDVLICLEFTNDYIPPSFLYDLALKCFERKLQGFTVHQLYKSGLWGSLEIANDCRKKAFVHIKIDPFQRHNRLFIHTTSECLLYATVWAPLQMLYPILTGILSSRSDVSFKAYPLCPMVLEDPEADLSEYVLYLKPQMDYHVELLKAITGDTLPPHTTCEDGSALFEGARKVTEIDVDCRRDMEHKHNIFLLFPHKGLSTV